MLEFLSAEEGASAVEYSILAGSIAVVIVTAVASLGSTVVKFFSTLLAMWP
jgi:Flp pilus assembly pilin Flp